MYTLNDGYRNDNNLIWIGSADVAGAYLAEFDEMFEGGLFGAASPAGEGRSFTVNDTGAEAALLEVWFSRMMGSAHELWS
jgi:hypothetical protein